MMARSSRWLTTSVRSYRRLLRVYPKPFRLEYGEEMAGVFEDMAAEALELGGTFALLSLWFHTVLDLGRTAAVQHYLETERRVVRLWGGLGRGRYRWLFAAAMTLAAFATPADPVSMLIVGTPLFGVLACVAISAGLPGSIRLPLVLTAAAGVAGLVTLTWTLPGTLCWPWIGLLYGVCILAILGCRRLPRMAQVLGISVCMLNAAVVIALRLWLEDCTARNGGFLAKGDPLEFELLLLTLAVLVPAIVASSSILLAVVVARTIRRRLPAA